MKNKSFYIIVCFCLALLMLFVGKSNLNFIWVAKANQYFKANNISMAQKYYEKAFDAGYNDSKSRDIYINTIINSPLTVEAQEKLVKFIENPKEDTARLKAEYFLYDIKREIYRKYPENYINNTAYNQKVMRWSKMPIKYCFEGSENAPKYFVEEIENAFTEWEKTTEHAILFSEDSINPNIVIKFETDNPINDNGSKYVVAYTSPDVNLNKLEKMEIKFYLKDSLGNYFSANQVYNTALHEIVHALGFMGHSNNKDHIMYLTKDSASILYDTREDITEADINTLLLLYNMKPQITDTDEYKAEYIPYFVLGDGKEVNSEKIKEAKIYIKKAPNLPAGYIDLAEGYVAEKDYPKAIKALEKALQLSDSEDITGMIYFNLAVTYFYIDHLEIARDYLNKSLAINDSEEKHYLLGEIYVREGNYSTAISEYSYLIRQNPNNIEYTIALANIYVINRDFLKARKILKNYLRLNSSERENPRLAPYGMLKLFL